MVARREAAALAGYSKASQRSQRSNIRVWTRAPSAAQAPSPDPRLVIDSNPASGAREASGEWLTAAGAHCRNVTIVASTDVVAIQTVAPLYFAYSLSRPSRGARPRRYEVQCRIGASSLLGTRPPDQSIGIASRSTFA